VLVLLATRVIPTVVRGIRFLGGGGHRDRAATVLALAVGGLPAGRQEWGEAMRVELDQVVGVRQRWRFSVGCAWAAVVIRMRASFGSREPGGAGLRIVVFTGIGAATGLVAYGLVRYPGLRSGNDVWASLVVFLAVLCIYGTLALTLSRGVSSQVRAARRHGLVGGLIIGGSWLAALSPPEALKGWVAFPLVVALFGPACVAAVSARQRHDPKTGTRAALWSGIVGGLGVFIVWVTTTFANDGGPYDAGLLRDFHKSHAPDLATYAVSDNLGSALVLLLVIPTVALAVGSLTARIASAPSPSTTEP
jgi:hypothetical protein